MTHRLECASRPLMARTPRVELLEDRHLLSGLWQPSVLQPAPFGAAPNDSPSPGPAIRGPLDHGLVHTFEARTGGGPWGPSTSTPSGGVSSALSTPADAWPLRSFGPPGVPDGRAYTPPDFHGGIPVAIVRIIDPNALGVAPSAISTFDPASRSLQAETAPTRPPASTGETPGGQVAAVGSGANALKVIAIPAGAVAAAGAAAVDVASPGMGISVAPSLAGLTGLASTVSVRDGRPVFDGVVEGPIASDPSGAIPEGSSAAIDPLDLAPSVVVQGADSRAGAGESSQEGEAGRLDGPVPAEVQPAHRLQALRSVVPGARDRPVPPSLRGPRPGPVRLREAVVPAGRGPRGDGRGPRVGGGHRSAGAALGRRGRRGGGGRRRDARRIRRPVRPLEPGRIMNADALDTLLERLTHGEIDAAEEVFLTFEPVLRVMVRRRLTPRLRAKFDSMDVVQSVWADRPEGLPRGGVAVHRPGPPEGVPRQGDVQPFRQELPRARPRPGARAADLRRRAAGAAPVGSAAAQRGRAGRRALGDADGPLPAGPSRAAPAQAAGLPAGRDRGPDRPAREQRPPDPLRPGAAAGRRAAERRSRRPGRRAEAEGRVMATSSLGESVGDEDPGPPDFDPVRLARDASRSRRWWPPGGGASGSRAEEFLARHPELGDEAAIRLIYEEVCLRHEAGLEVDPAEVVRPVPPVEGRAGAAPRLPPPDAAARPRPSSSRRWARSWASSGSWPSSAGARRGGSSWPPSPRWPTGRSS